MIKILDLNFMGHQQAIASFLVETSMGPVLIETGPYSTFESLSTALGVHGYKPEDVEHVLLSHIHLDHAGAAWAFATRGATVYLHPAGARHMEDPGKLMQSARMIYGDDMDRLWGKMDRIAPERLRTVADGTSITVGDQRFTAMHTPGHAKHHIAWVTSGKIFTGDVAGVKIGDGPVVPPCPPPDIDLEAWNNSIDLVLAQPAEELYLTHYGIVTYKEAHMKELRDILNDWAHWIRERWEAGATAEELTPQFTKYTTAQLRDRGVDEEGVQRYEAASPSWMSVAGLIRYWQKKSTG